MIHLYANGDSNTNGDELGGETWDRDFDPRYRDEHCFVGILSKGLGFNKWTNDALGAGSNDRMFRRTLGFTAEWLKNRRDPSELFVVIGWSHCARNEFYFDPCLGSNSSAYLARGRDITPEDERNYWKYYVNPKRQHKETPKQVIEFLADYERWFISQSAAMTRTINHIVSLQSYLRQHGFPYLFFNSGWPLDPTGTQSSDVFRLINKKRYPFPQDPDFTFHGWTWKNGAKGRMPRGHPNEEAHRKWAEFLLKYIHDNKLGDPKS